MTHALKKSTVALLVVLVFSGSLTAQSANPFQVSYFLPGDATIKTAALEIAEGDLAEAVRTVLNSPGDSMILLLEVEGSLGYFANVGLLGSQEVKLERVEVPGGYADVYELSFVTNGGLAFGAELIEGIELAIPVGGELGVVMHFDRVEDIGRGLEAAALAGIGLPALLMELTRLDSLLRSAIAAIPSLEQTVNFLNTSRQILHNIVVDFSQRAAAARQAFFDALRRAEAQVERLRRIPFIGPLIAALARPFFQIAYGCESLLISLDASWQTALANLNSTLCQWEARNLELAQKYDFVANTQTALNHVLDWIILCGHEVAWLGQRFQAFAARFEVGAEVEAKVAIENVVPGLSLANSGLGATLGEEVSVGLRYDLPRYGEPGRLTIDVERDTSLELQAILVGGVQGEGTAALSANVVFCHHGSQWNLYKSETSLEVELGAWAVVGLVTSAEYGAGVTLSVSADNLHNGGCLVDAFTTLVQGDPQGALQQLGSLQATFKAQGWRHMSGVIGAGYSAAGNGLTLGGAATWRDASPEYEISISAAQAVDAILVQAPALLTDLVNDVTATM